MSILKFRLICFSLMFAFQDKHKKRKQTRNPEL